MIGFLNSYSNVFIAIASFGTFISSIIVLLTLFEMRRQRIVSFQPELVLKEMTRIDLYYAGNKINIYGGPFRWENSHKVEPRINHSFIDLYNIGNGPAKSIEVNWVFDIHYFINEIEKRDKDKLFKFTYNNNNKADKLLILTELSLINIEPAGFINKFEFLLPTSVNDLAIHIPISRAFMMLYSIWLFLVLRETSSFDNFECNDIPGSKIQIKYKDSQNNKYIKEYKLSLEYLSAGEVGNETNEGKLICSAFIAVK